MWDAVSGEEPPRVTRARKGARKGPLPAWDSSTRKGAGKTAWDVDAGAPRGGTEGVASASRAVEVRVEGL